MAKISFTKLGLTKNTEIKIFSWNGQNIEIKQYLPFQEKMDLITEVLNNCQDSNNFINIAKLNVFMKLEIIFKYSNINFTEKQKEDYTKLYDLLYGSGFIKEFFNYFPEDEYQEIKKWTIDIAHNIYEYRNSVYAILDSMKTDYDSLNFNASEIKEKISDGENIELVKDVLSKLG